jgi:hypothetical protein
MKHAYKHKNIFRTLVAVVSLASVVAVAGCGDDSSSAEAPSKAVFIKQGDKLCKKANDRQLALLQRYAKDHEAEGGTRGYEEKIVVVVGLPPMEEEAEQLSELTPPEGDEEKVDEIVSGIEEGVEKTKADPAGGLKPAGENTFAEAEKLARAYGFKVCAEI